MKILVVGGTGMIGAHAALYLQAQGHQVAVAGRNPPAANTPLGELEFVRCDYIANDLPHAQLARFDALVFAAGKDPRDMPADEDPAAYWQRVNIDAVPRFFAAARAAGIRYAINIGSFYPQARPELIDKNLYVRSRKLADDGVRALASSTFHVVSLNAPFAVGWVPGLVMPMFRAYVRYAAGKLPIPEFVPPGGVNFISTQSLSEAVEGAILRGKNGHAYLIGDQNLSFQEYFGAFFRACDRAMPPVQDQEHPLMPDAAIIFGRGNSLFYEPDAAETAELGYRRNDVLRIIPEIVAQYREA